MKYKSNLKNVKKALDNASDLTLDAVGRAARGYVKANAPVDTGALRGSIDYKVDKKIVYVGSTLMSEDYPIYVEKGTSRGFIKRLTGKTGKGAQPYIRPGIMDNLSQLKKIAERNFKL